MSISQKFETEISSKYKNLSKIETINSFMLNNCLAGIDIRLMLESIYDAYKKNAMALKEERS